MQMNPYLSFNGHCKSAFRFYERVLGGKITFMATWGESPEAALMPPESRELIMHATLAIDDAVLMGADCPPESYEQPKGISVLLGIKNTADGERIFNALSENGTVQMPFQQSFWSPGFGMVFDQFGVPWMVNCEAA